jgi:hypothetical protein
LSDVYAGLANGFQQTQNIDPTVVVRIKLSRRCSANAKTGSMPRVARESQTQKSTRTPIVGAKFTR